MGQARAATTCSEAPTLFSSPFARASLLWLLYWIALKFRYHAPDLCCPCLYTHFCRP